MNGKVSRKADCVAATVADELVVMSVDLGRYFGLNLTAARVWELLEEPRTVDELCESLAQEYEVERGTCELEITALLEDLRKEGLVTFD
jgi:coenzyme PQQ synthesis protein D (PqqD)